MSFRHLKHSNDNCLYLLPAESYQDMRQLANTASYITQTGVLQNATNLTISSLSVTPPEPIRADPMGGVRASNETGKCIIIT